MSHFLPPTLGCFLFLYLRLLITSGSADETCSVSKDGSCSAGADDEDALVEEGLRLKDAGDEDSMTRVFEKLLQINPKNGNALFQLGFKGLTSPDGATQNQAFERLERAFDSDVQPPLAPDSPPGQYIATMIGRRYAEGEEYQRADKFLNFAAFSASARGHCQLVQLSSHITPYPSSIENAAKMLDIYHKRMQAILDAPHIEPEPLYKGREDMYIFCLLTAFSHSFFYESDARSAVSKHSQVAARLFPELLFTSPHLATRVVRPEASRVRLGVVSAFFTWMSSVIDDFGGVLERLPREKFDITFIYLNQTGAPSYFLEYNTKRDAAVSFDKDPAWLERARSKIASLDLDLLLYIDLTMSSMCQTLGMSRLAPVQATSHGHPITSGIDKSIMNYYVSWAAAELPTAQDHYTEELALLPAHTMHQYYEPRVSPDGQSTRDFQPFEHLRRADFGIPVDGHWYVCMQKPFKRHPVFDAMLADVLSADKEARIILHEAGTPRKQKVMVSRFRRLNMDLRRVHFLDAQPHHRVMALYRLSNVILDSYYAGGCTTTREALEVGGMVVTLPAKYLGSRWSLAYYSIIGVMDLVAKDKQDYVRIAVHLASDDAARSALQQRVRENLHKMYYRTEAVDAWANLLSRLASSRSAS